MKFVGFLGPKQTKIGPKKHANKNGAADSGVILASHKVTRFFFLSSIQTNGPYPGGEASIRGGGVYKDF